MPKKLNVQPGDKYGHLLIIRETEPFKWQKYKHRAFLCQCKCGNTTTVRLEYLRSGHTTTCGCGRSEYAKTHKFIHGKSKTRLYGIWNGMKNRCFNPNRQSYKDYGDKGVTVCNEWMEFEPFYNWATNNGYQDDLTIERLDPFGNYEPSNCTWIPKAEQAKNKRIHARAAND